METAGRRETGRKVLLVVRWFRIDSCLVSWFLLVLGLGHGHYPNPNGLGIGFGLILVLIVAQSSHHFTLILLFSYLFLIVCTLIGQVRLGGTV